MAVLVKADTGDVLPAAVVPGDKLVGAQPSAGQSRQAGDLSLGDLWTPPRPVGRQ
jgi:hypothetical protein